MLATAAVPTRAESAGDRPFRLVRAASGYCRRRVPAAAVLVGDVAPAPAWQRPVRVDAERLHGVRELRPHGIQVLPVVAKVEDVAKLFAQPQPAQPDLGSVQRSVWFLAVPPAVRGDDRAVGEGELVQVVAVPAGEGVIDRRGELLERYRAVANYRDGQVGSRSY